MGVTVIMFERELLNLIATANSIVALNGAGVSAESGIPTFRDALTGLWARYNPEELATPQAFGKNPQLVSRWYDQRRCDVLKCMPNAGHIALARLEETCRQKGRPFTLITQNVDRLHRAAGSQNVIELHGNLFTWRCIDCGWEADESGPAFDEHPPRCECGGLRRPGVVWFGEALPGAALLKAQRASGKCALFMSLGTSSVVYPAAALVDLAFENGAKVLEINPEQTPLSRRAHWSLRGKCGEILPDLIDRAGS